MAHFHVVVREATLLRFHLVVLMLVSCVICEQFRVMRDFGKENNASASAAGGLRDYDKHSVVSNTMQKVSLLYILYKSLL